MKRTTKSCSIYLSANFLHLSYCQRGERCGRVRIALDEHYPWNRLCRERIRDGSILRSDIEAGHSSHQASDAASPVVIDQQRIASSGNNRNRVNQPQGGWNRFKLDSIEASSQTYTIFHKFDILIL